MHSLFKWMSLDGAGLSIHDRHTTSYCLKNTALIACAPVVVEFAGHTESQPRVGPQSVFIRKMILLFSGWELATF